MRAASNQSRRPGYVSIVDPVDASQGCLAGTGFAKAALPHAFAGPALTST